MLLQCWISLLFALSPLFTRVLQHWSLISIVVVNFLGFSSFLKHQKLIYFQGEMLHFIVVIVACAVFFFFFLLHIAFRTIMDYKWCNWFWCLFFVHSNGRTSCAIIFIKLHNLNKSHKINYTKMNLIIYMASNSCDKRSLYSSNVRHCLNWATTATARAHT